MTKTTGCVNIRQSESAHFVSKSNVVKPPQMRLLPGLRRWERGPLPLFSTISDNSSQ